MKKCTPHIGCLRRDPKHYRFSIPNEAWEYKLKPIEFVILSYLCSIRSRSHSSEIISTEAVARAVHLTAGTVKKYLVTLVGKGLITKKYVPTFQCADSKKFFTLPNEIFLLNIPPSAFMVYAYLLLIENRQTHTCHPSYNTIVVKTGLSKNTAIKSVSILLDKGLIVAEHSQYFDAHGMKWNGNNLYTVQPIRQVMGMREVELLDEMKRAAAQRKWDEKCRSSTTVTQGC